MADAEMHTDAFLVCRAERRDRPLVNAFFEAATAIEPGRRGALEHA